MIWNGYYFLYGFNYKIAWGEQNISPISVIYITCSIEVYKTNKQLLNSVKVWKAKETNVILNMLSTYQKKTKKEKCHKQKTEHYIYPKRLI